MVLVTRQPWNDQRILYSIVIVMYIRTLLTGRNFILFATFASYRII